MLSTKLALIALALAAGLVASDTASIAPDSVILQAYQVRPRSTRCKTG